MKELRFSTLKENGADFGNFFPPEIMLEDFFPEEAEEDKRLNGRFRKFKNIDEISNEDVDAQPGFQHLIPVIPDESRDLGEDPNELPNDFILYDLDDPEDFILYDLDDPEDRFGDDVGKPFVIAIIQSEEKEDKKLVSENFIPFSKTKIKCAVHKRPHGRRGRNDKYKNITRKSLRNLSLSL